MIRHITVKIPNVCQRQFTERCFAQESKKEEKRADRKGS
jgi:hypothetical protein